MICPNCAISGQRLIFSLPDSVLNIFREGNTSLMNHYKILDASVETNEVGGKELVDFLEAMNLEENVSFQINNESWKPIHKFSDYVNANWVDDLIKNRQVNMHFQPIITKDGNIYGYEMLARFFNGEGKTLYPNIVFPAAKLRGRTFALDRVCRIEAVKKVKHLVHEEKVFINFLPTAIYSPEYCLRTTTLVANQLGIDSQRFVFEVVETEKIEDVDHLKSILLYYKQNGFSFALDDVGSGYNTLDLLADLEPPYMKLDMTYVQGVTNDKEKQAVALSFLKKAKELGSLTLAEGIETPEDFLWFKDTGYDLFQGYYFGKPAPFPLNQTTVNIPK
ncbi:EAL domain-containing protein [Lacticigenium naphthae]|uniref:EAL domain-containing protein n=1 Tax=Lacticigenium naphthae TaxID=515351 RepID=UPI0004051246|nr:EAL domain-containing protein [Lacticigenium naphthae]